MILRYQANAKELTIPPKQVLRYAGQGTQAPSADLLQLLSSCKMEFLDCASCRAAGLEVEITREEDTLLLGSLSVTSKSLSEHLVGCDRGILFCATLGGGLERLFLRYGKTSPARALLLDAIGSAAIEEWCDRLEEGWTREAALRGLVLQERFSPGYGDLPLAYQAELLALLCAAQTTGVSATSGMMLVPKKSVTAIIGLKKEEI